MSMLTSQCDRLRDRAKELRTLAPGLSAPYVVPSTKETMALAMQSAASELEQAADAIEGLRDALRRACQFIADYGSCPYDTFDLYEPWEESCYQKCSADIDRAECWRRYFERGDLI